MGRGKLDIESVIIDDLGCQVGSLPIHYLGLPLGSRFKNKEVWDLVVDRMRKKLVGWKAQFLSRGGRVTLIKVALASIPVYFLSFFVIPSQVALQIEKLQMIRGFIWWLGIGCVLQNKRGDWVCVGWK